MGGSDLAISEVRQFAHRSGQRGLLIECMIWAIFVAAIYAGIATVSDWDRFEPETLAEYRGIIFDRWSFVPDYLTWIGVPLGTIVWIHSRYASRSFLPAARGGEYHIFDMRSEALGSPTATFVVLYLVAMVLAGVGRIAIIRCWMRGECDFFTWYQAVLYSAVILIWPLLLLLLRRAVWAALRR